MKNKVIFFILIMTFILGTVSYFTLPDTVAVQWSRGEVTNTMPKLGAILITYAVTAVCFLLFGEVYNRINKAVALKGAADKVFTACKYLLSSLGLILQIVILAGNI